VPETVRERTIRWQDPVAFQRAAGKLSGIEVLRAMVRGELPPPPIAELLGLRLTSIGPSVVTFEFDPGEYMYSPLGTVHGGILTVLLDSAMGCAFQTTLPAGTTYTTLELKVNFVRPVTDRSGTMRAEGRVVHAGGTVATTEARLRGADGSLFAHATSTLLVRRPAPG